MKNFNNKTYYFSIFLWIVANNILTCMENDSTKNIININNQQLSLCSTTNIPTEIDVENQEYTEEKDVRDELIVRLQTSINNIWKEGEYNFISVWNSVSLFVKHRFIPSIDKMLEKQPKIVKENFEKNGNKKVILEKENDSFGYEKNKTKGEEVLFCGHFKSLFEKFGIEINEDKKTIFYGLWLNNKKYLGVEFNEKECFIGTWNKNKEKECGIIVTSSNIQILAPEFHTYKINKKYKKEYEEKFKKYDFKEMNDLYCGEQRDSDHNVDYFLTKLKRHEKKKYIMDFNCLKGKKKYDYYSNEFAKSFYNYKYPGLEDHQIITDNKILFYSNRDLLINMTIVFDQQGIYNIRMAKSYYIEKDSLNTRFLYFLRDSLLDLEQKNEEEKTLKRYSLFLREIKENNFWADNQNKNECAIFFENYHTNNVGNFINKYNHPYVCFFDNGTFMYKEKEEGFNPKKSIFLVDMGYITFKTSLFNAKLNTYKYGQLVYETKNNNTISYFSKKNYEYTKDNYTYKTNEKGKLSFFSNGNLNVNIDRRGEEVIYNCSKNNYKYIIFTKKDIPEKIIISDGKQVKILFPNEKKFLEINEYTDNNIEECSEEEENCIYEDLSPEEDKKENEEEEILYKKFFAEYELDSLLLDLNNIQQIEGFSNNKLLLDCNEYNQQKSINKNFIYEEKTIKNDITINKLVENNEEKSLKVFKLNKKQIKKKKKNKKPLNNKILDNNKKLENTRFYYSNKEYYSFPCENFTPSQANKNIVLYKCKDTDLCELQKFLERNKLYKKFNEVLSSLIYDYHCLDMKFLPNSSFEVRLNRKYRFYVKKEKEDIYLETENKIEKKPLANFFFILLINIYHIKQKK